MIQAHDSFSALKISFDLSALAAQFKKSNWCGRFVETRQIAVLPQFRVPLHASTGKHGTEI
jgi:hypothetical protein